MNLINTFHKVATLVIKKLQRMLGIITLGARAIVLNADNQVLLVKHTYQPHWYLPGGGVKKGESAKAAVIRELKEEVGVCVAQEEPQLFGIYFHTYFDVDDHPVIFSVRRYEQVTANSGEIEQMGWFHYDKLPDMISPGTQRRLNEFFAKATLSDRW